MPTIDQRIMDLLTKGSPSLRVKICENEPMYFAIYYFSDYFDYTIPPFHYDFYQDIKDLASGTLEEAMWCTFRDGAKTSIAKIAFLIWLIVYKKKQYINWDSYDGDNSEAALFDATVALQTNTKIIRDFGQVYHKKKEKNALMEAKMKRIKSFITETGIRVQAFTTQEPTRGRLYENQRPDCFIFDDFENNKTRDSYPITKKIKDHIDELRAGLPANACVLYLCNYITEDGSVAYLMEKIKENPRGRVRNIPVVDRDGNIAWPDKFVKTAKEAEDINKTIPVSREWKISLEARRKSLGKSVFEAEMMNNPAFGADKVFDRSQVELMLKNVTEPLRTIAGFKIWKEFDPSHRYAIAADTAKGIGRDSNASVTIDFSTIPNRVVATYKNNLMPPDTFGYELKRQGELYGIPLICPENNEPGGTTINVLKNIYPTTRIYVALQEDKVKRPVATEYGWNTNAATKPEMIYQLKRAVEDGLLVIYDEDLLNEMKYYAQKDLVTYTLVEGMTRHFDLLTACAIAWMMKSYAKLSDINRKKTLGQKDYVPAAGEYGG